LAAISLYISESAIADLDEIAEWYSQQGTPHVGARRIADIFKRIGALRNHPGMGRIVPEFDQPLLRELIHPPFRIVYRRRSKKIWIIRIWRSERLLALVDETVEG
jgi:plasmid stabilization system protein ParE